MSGQPEKKLAKSLQVSDINYGYFLPFQALGLIGGIIAGVGAGLLTTAKQIINNDENTDDRTYIYIWDHHCSGKTGKMQMRSLSGKIQGILKCCQNTGETLQMCEKLQNPGF